MHLLAVRYSKCQRGAYLVWAALLLPVMAGFLALAIDIGLVMGHKRQAQIAADAAAVAGALNIDPTNKQNSASLAGREAAKDNGFDNDDPNIEVVVNVSPNVTQTQSPYYYNATNGDYVAATITSRSPGIFSRLPLVNIDHFTIVTNAVALSAASAVIECPGVYTDRIDTPRGINLQRGGFTINNGGIYVGDIHEQSIGGSSDGFMTADWIKLGGGNSGGITYTCRESQICPETNVVPTRKPEMTGFQDRCDYENVEVAMSGSTAVVTCTPTATCRKPALDQVDANGFYGLPAGYYCITPSNSSKNALTITGAKVKLRPNGTNEVFVFKNANFLIQSAGSGGNAVKSEVKTVANSLSGTDYRAGVVLYAMDTTDLAYIDDPNYIASSYYYKIEINGTNQENKKSTLSGPMRLLANMIVLNDALLTVDVFSDVGGGSSFESCGEFGTSGLIQ